MRDFEMPRRRFVLASASLTLGLLTPARGLGQPSLDATDFGVVPGNLADQSAALQRALDAARDTGRTLVLPAGHIFAQNLQLPANTRVIGQPGATFLLAWQNNPIARAYLGNNLVLEGIGFSATPGVIAGGPDLLEIESSVSVRIVDCAFTIGAGNGIATSDSEITIADCDFAELAEAAIFSRNSRGLSITNNRILRCGNGGVLIWRDEPGPDRSMITGNHIAEIASQGGGNGQNGNGVNVFRAGEVIVADNHISRCAFSAVRLNASIDTQVRGNTCTASGEVAIFSEFGFSGSVISGNIVDGAAGGISMTNFNEGGRLAICSGNLVRNIAPFSAVNPDTTPFGIFAEADTVISANTVETVPGVGIGAGWGPYLRDVVVSDNLVRDCEIGIAVSVADGAGVAQITGNLVSGARKAGLAGMAWTDTVSTDLAADSARFPQITLSANSVR